MLSCFQQRSFHVEPSLTLHVLSKRARESFKLVADAINRAHAETSFVVVLLETMVRHVDTLWHIRRESNIHASSSYSPGWLQQCRRR